MVRNTSLKGQGEELFISQISFNAVYDKATPDFSDNIPLENFQG